MTPFALTDALSSLPAPRMDRAKRHPLLSMLFIAIAGIACGADDWVSVARFWRSKETWLRTFLDLLNVILSHDTFSRVFSLLDPDAFARSFGLWGASFSQLAQGDVVALDGKTLRRSFDRASGRGAIHMVSARVAKNEVVLGQLKTEEKSYEITAIPKLLDTLLLKGSVVTIDAMGCQKEIAAKLVGKEADYVLVVKENQPKISAEIEPYFREAVESRFVGERFDYTEESGEAHGRKETRRVWCTSAISWIDGDRLAEWRGLRSVIMVEACRTTLILPPRIASLENLTLCLIHSDKSFNK